MAQKRKHIKPLLCCVWSLPQFHTYRSGCCTHISLERFVPHVLWTLKPLSHGKKHCSNRFGFSRCAPSTTAPIVNHMSFFSKMLDTHFLHFHSQHGGCCSGTNQASHMFYSSRQWWSFSKVCHFPLRCTFVWTVAQMNVVVCNSCKILALLFPNGKKI